MRFLTVVVALGSLAVAAEARAACAEDQTVCNAMPAGCKNPFQVGGCCTALPGVRRKIATSLGHAACMDFVYCCPVNGSCSGGGGPYEDPAGVCKATTLTCSGQWLDCHGAQADGCEIDGANDVANCGACNADCSSNNITPHCSSGNCDGTCASGFADCNGDKRSDGCETNTKTDANSCNACGHKCSDDVANATGIGCTNGACTFSACTAPFASCDANAANGCEINTSTDANNCNGCGNKCSDVVKNVVGTISCGSSTCTYSGVCADGWGDCDGNKSNGCETNLKTSATHCGSCPNACSAPTLGTAICVDGACDFTCPAKRCGSVCAACCTDGDCPLDNANLCKDPSCTNPGLVSATCGFKDKVCVQKECYTDVTCIPATGECASSPKSGGTCKGDALGCCDPPGSMGTCSSGTCDCPQKDCTTNVPVCKTGLCGVDGNCTTENQANGTACTPTNKCLQTTQCAAGECVGTLKTCTPSKECRVPSCDEGSGDCVEVNATTGTSCVSPNPCVQNTACNDSGDCVGVALPDATPCALADCTTATCHTGACQCDSAGNDMAVVAQPDLAATDAAVGPTPDLAKTGADKSGCAVGDPVGASTTTTFFLIVAVLAVLRRSRSRA